MTAPFFDHENTKTRKKNPDAAHPDRSKLFVLFPFSCFRVFVIEFSMSCIRAGDRGDRGGWGDVIVRRF